MNLPNKLTILRVLLIPVFLLFLMTDIFGDNSRYIATGIFLFASFTDALDGYIARKYNLISNFGKFMDPLADKLLVCSALIAMIELGDISSIPVIIIISREFIITGFRLVAADNDVVIAASVWGKAKTISQMIMVTYLLIGISGDIYMLIGQILVGISVLFTLVSAVDYIYKNKNILKMQ